MIDTTTQQGTSRGKTPKPRKFYILGPDLRGGGPGHGVEIANEAQLLTPPRLIIRPEEGGFPVLREKPQLVHVKKLGKLPRDLEGGMSGYWLVSERLKQVFEAVDPEGFAFVACDFTLSDGTPGPQYYLCEVLRTLDALDEERSKVKLEIGAFKNGKFYNMSGGASLVFKEEAIGPAHIFRTPFTSHVFCDSALRDACKEAGLKDVRFRDTSKL